MGYNFVAEDHDQLFLMPPSITDWLPVVTLLYFVLDAVEEVDLSGFYAGYRADGWGGAARHPTQTMVALLLYAYCTGVVSSRKFEQACHVDVAFRVVWQRGACPHHDRTVPVASRGHVVVGVHRLAAAVREGGDDQGGAGRGGRHEDGRAGVAGP